MTLTEFPFELPLGLTDEQGVCHKEGVMRLATAADEILPLRDHRVVENPAYKDIIRLARVVTRIGSLPSVGTKEIEALYLRDLNHLRDMYHEINGLGRYQPIAPSP